MKITHSLIILTAVLFSVQACDQKSTPATTRSISPPSAASPPSSPDSRSEALSAAEKEWAKVWIQNGETWIARAENKSYLLQIKGRSVEVAAETLTEADRLNGVQWKGTVAFFRTAERRFGFESSGGRLTMNPYEAGWNEWTTPAGTQHISTHGEVTGAIAAFKFKKQNDKWAQPEVDLEQLEFGRDAIMIRPTTADLRASLGANTSSP